MHQKLMKQWPHCFRIVPDTEYITDLRTINLEIKMLFQTFCTPPPTIQE